MAELKSMDELELEKYLPYSRLIDTPFETIETEPGSLNCEGINRSLSLDGEWTFAPDGFSDERTDITKDWKDGMKADAPASVHKMLVDAGVLEDPTFAVNDRRAREMSHRTWWFRKDFTYGGNLSNPVLHFDGVCYRAQFWLNGQYLGWHGGMFGGPDYNVSGLLKENNVLIVRIYDAPSNPFPQSETVDVDDGWWHGVTINCVYGWHYASIPSRGIWRSVHIDETPMTTTEKPFFSTVSTDGTVRLIFRTEGRKAEGTIKVSVSPKNFEGKTFCFTKHFTKESDGVSVIHYQFKIDDPHLWWPNGYGEQYLYTANVSFEPDNDIPSYYTETFGIRTVEMGPQVGGVSPDKLNLTYIINGKSMFIKGTNWCTTDVLLRFPKERYERFLGLAKAQHVMLLRAWGGGMPETDDFYDTCDELGIMVRQEWPTCWDSDRLQPVEELKDTVIRAVKRIRNHPSLVTLAGGNESHYADSPAMTEMARMGMEYDGSRMFHKSSPFGGNEEHVGGTIHNYDTYWGRQSIDATLQLSAAFIGEFGAASSPNLGSVMKYLPENEKKVWPLPYDSAFWHHMPRFNSLSAAYDNEFMEKHVHEFSKCNNMQGWIDATQLLQATITRHLLEKFRSRWPYSTGLCYYKLTDVYPAASWSTIDYYGVPKLSYYVIQDAYTPVHSSLIFSSVDVHAGDTLPVYFFDDNLEYASEEKTVSVRAFAGTELIASSDYTVAPSDSTVIHAGDFFVDGKMAESKPLFIVCDVKTGENKIDRTFYWLNFRDSEGCMYETKKARLVISKDGETLRVRNISGVPAMGVIFESDDDRAEFSDNMIWIDAGEEVLLTVKNRGTLSVRGFNL